jgi:hypothetical protein
VRRVVAGVSRASLCRRLPVAARLYRGAPASKLDGIPCAGRTRQSLQFGAARTQSLRVLKQVLFAPRSTNKASGPNSASARPRYLRHVEGSLPILACDLHLDPIKDDWPWEEEGPWPALVRWGRGRRGWTGRFWPAGLGGHRGWTGRVWRRPRPRKSHRDAGLFQIGAGRFSSHTGGLLDRAQRPSQAPKGQNLLLIGLAQDVHLGGGPHLPRLVKVLFLRLSLAGFQLSITGRFWVSPKEVAENPGHRAHTEHRPRGEAGYSAAERHVAAMTPAAPAPTDSTVTRPRPTRSAARCGGCAQAS